MKVLILYRTCKITFDETDGKYAGKTLALDGESTSDTCFYVNNPIKMFWTTPSLTHPNRFIGTSVDEADRDELWRYIIQEAKRLGISISA